MSIWRIITPLALILVLGCSSHEELPPPDNPFDPGNPDYVSPEAEITSGPSEGEIIGNTSVTLVWEGNESATEYRYRFDFLGWSEWDETTSTTFEYLDEGTHNFELMARSVNGEEQSISTLLDFGVDAVAGPAILIYPYMQSASPGDTVDFQIFAEEVSDLFAVECQIQFDDEILELIEVIDGDLLTEWGGTALSIQEVSESIVDFSVVAVEGSNTTFEGTTSIFLLRLRIKQSANLNIELTAISVTNGVFINPHLEAIDLVYNRPGVLNVW
jgi:hypothetical protein